MLWSEDTRISTMKKATAIDDFKINLAIVRGGGNSG